MTERQPDLRYRFTIRAETAAPRVIGDSGSGALHFLEIVGGTVRGDLEGEILTGGGDWATVRPDGTVLLDARYQFRTTGGALVDVHNVGIAHLTPDFAVPYIASTPVFRTDHPALARLEQVVHVGPARNAAGVTEVDVFELVPVRSVLPVDDYGPGA